MNGYLATTAFFIDDVIVKDAPEAHYRMISPDYFRALGMTLRSGRAFTPADRADAPPVAIVNETFARLNWSGANPIGARLRLADGETVPRVVEVIGVIGDVKHFGLEKETTIEVYVPISQVPDATTIWLANNMYWVVETAGAPLASTNAVRREIAAVDPGVPASFVRSMDEWMRASNAPRRFNLQLVTAFALAALLLAIVGVYAVSASAVALRTREIGIRAALGATRPEVIRLVLRGALAPVLLGLIAGMAGASLSAGATVSLLFGVTPHDPISLAIVAVVLTTAAAVASYVPARRAGRVDPIVALRADNG
jgi:putative ABC transport system permease protein